ncbi:MAG: hypothetical protein MRECE_8c030 [Mycoplasmataceae bacterium CE_OT135]|nr:MAG: hypothetical protein MRECE_8c030 [Mycoplasmataceae bacterium CE_OT135]
MSVSKSEATIFRPKGTSGANELENKIQQFSSSDYSVSENGKEKTYTIHSDDLKKVLLVYFNDGWYTSIFSERDLPQEFKVIIGEKFETSETLILWGNDSGHGFRVKASPENISNLRERERERETSIIP